jgi:hypothetical protein
MTKDLDVFIESSPENAIAMYTTLAEFGAPLAKLTVEYIADVAALRHGIIRQA